MVSSENVRYGKTATCLFAEGRDLTDASSFKFIDVLNKSFLSGFHFGARWWIAVVSLKICFPSLEGSRRKGLGLRGLPPKKNNDLFMSWRIRSASSVQSYSRVNYAVSVLPETRTWRNRGRRPPAFTYNSGNVRGGLPRSKTSSHPGSRKDLIDMIVEPYL